MIVDRASVGIVLRVSLNKMGSRGRTDPLHQFLECEKDGHGSGVTAYKWRCEVYPIDLVLGGR